MIMASKYVDRVEKLVVWSSKAFVTEKDLELYETFRDVKDWPEDFVSQDHVECYDDKYYADTWAAWIDSLHAVLRENDGNICREALPKIQAPTLVLHGALDNLVPTEHVVYLHENIKNSTWVPSMPEQHECNNNLWICVCIVYISNRVTRRRSVEEDNVLEILGAMWHFI